MSDGGGGGGGGTVSYCCFMQTEDPLNGNKDEQKLLTGFIFLTQICCCSSFSRSLHQAMKGGGAETEPFFRLGEGATSFYSLRAKQIFCLGCFTLKTKKLNSETERT